MKKLTNEQLAERLDHIRESVVDEWNHPITAAEDLRDAASRLKGSNLEVAVSQDVLFWAFRYCLSRSSYAVDDGVHAVVENWWKLKPSMRLMIHKEINHHFETHGAGIHGCDRKSWEMVLSLPVER